MMTNTAEMNAAHPDFNHLNIFQKDILFVNIVVIVNISQIKWYLNYIYILHIDFTVLLIIIIM